MLVTWLPLHNQTATDVDICAVVFVHVDFSDCKKRTARHVIDTERDSDDNSQAVHTTATCTSDQQGSVL